MKKVPYTKFTYFSTRANPCINIGLHKQGFPFIQQVALERRQKWAI